MSIPNPYASPVAPPPSPLKEMLGGPGQSQMEYMRAYHYIFENPNWLTTVLYIGLLGLAAIIPGVGLILQLFFLGYQFEVLEMLLRTRGTKYPDFDFGRIGEYLGRGVWPFLVNLVASIVIVPVIYVALIVMVVMVGLAASVAGENAGPIVAILFGTVAFVVFLALVMALTMLLVPMILRAGLSQDFVAAFQFNWIIDFVKKMYIEMILTGLFLMATAMALGLLGFLACFIGIFAVVPILLLAQTHLLYQLYSIYLTRGGMPVPVKVAVPLPMAPR
jgi:hypothetical protein